MHGNQLMFKRGVIHGQKVLRGIKVCKKPKIEQDLIPKVWWKPRSGHDTQHQPQL